MRGVNSIVLCGAISQPEMIKFSEGDKPRGEILEFSLVTERAYRNKAEEWVTIPEWHEVRIFNPRLIEKSILAQLSKGMVVSVVGRLQYDTWNDQGKNRRKAFIAAETFEILVKTVRLNPNSEQTSEAPTPTDVDA